MTSSASETATIAIGMNGRPGVQRAQGKTGRSPVSIPPGRFPVNISTDGGESARPGVGGRVRQARAGQVAILTFHAIGRDGGWDNIPTDIVERMLDHLRRNQCRTTTDVAAFLLPPTPG